MDLTKVVLPTFILERRSLLEMYADCFAHPDIFLKWVHWIAEQVSVFSVSSGLTCVYHAVNRAADLDTPRDRMVQILKWYLSSFHAGRKSAVAKKPYNPILGEIFQCWWNLDNVTNNTDEGINADGPVPWCKNNQLVFIAEQVSHHPPSMTFLYLRGHILTEGPMRRSINDTYLFQFLLSTPNIRQKGCHYALMCGLSQNF